MSNNHLPIGIFDSGVGGLTVLDAIRETLPGEDYLYLGDTARVPYGNRTPQTIIRYAISCAKKLTDRGIKALVIACNTASAYAIDALRAQLDIPVYGVIEPASLLSVQMTRSNHIALIGTRATINSRSYERAIHQLNPDVRIHALPCPLFVPLVEEGWGDSLPAKLIIEQYFAQLFAQPDAEQIDTLILGCTHYPVLKTPITNALQSLNMHVSLCDCGIATAQILKKEFETHHRFHAPQKRGNVTYLVTDSPAQFIRIGESFMHSPPENVEYIDIM